MNDLIEEVKDLNLGIKFGEEMLSALLYADDIVLLAENEEDLQQQLNIVHSWCSKWRISINMDKTKIMHFRTTSQAESTFSFTLGDRNVNYADHYRYLGYDLYYNLNYEHGTNILAAAAGRALGSLVSKFFKHNGLTYATYTKLYHSTVVPVCDYAAGIWGIRNYKKCQTLQNRAMRTFMGVGRMTPILFLYGDMKWVPHYIRQEGEVLRLWMRLLEMDDARLTKKVFLWDYNLSIEGKTNWNTSVRTLLASSGLEHIFLDKSLHGQSKKHIIDTFTKKQMDEYHEKWKQEVRDVSRLENYTQYKDNIVLENYVTSKIITRHERLNLAKLRSGTLPIEIEKGRYRNTARHERLCKQCSIGVVETEQHFLLDCPTYHSEITEFKNKICTILGLGNIGDVVYVLI